MKGGAARGATERKEKKKKKKTEEFLPLEVDAVAAAAVTTAVFLCTILFKSIHIYTHICTVYIHMYCTHVHEYFPETQSYRLMTEVKQSQSDFRAEK